MRQRLSKRMVMGAMKISAIDGGHIGHEVATRMLPSWRIIEHAGGSLKDKVWGKGDQEAIRRYRVIS